MTSFSNNIKAKVVEVGQEGGLVIVLDDFFTRPDSLREAAYNANFTEPKQVNFPGIRAPAPNEYANQIIKIILPLIEDIFKVVRPKFIRYSSEFSIVNRPISQLKVKQILPHFDETYDLHFAILHYLTRDSCFGTSFYRHGATGYERITLARKEKYIHTLNNEIQIMAHKRNKFILENNFKRISSFSGEFNKVIVYQGCSLHSGDIPEDGLLFQDPRRGRLTINTFFRI